MRPRFAVLAAAFLILSTFSIAQPALARAQPYTISGCSETEPRVEYCYTENGVVQYHETPSGRSVGVENIRVSYTLTDNGVVVEAGQQKLNSVYLSHDGQSEVETASGSRTYTYTDPDTGETVRCRYTTTYTYANGEFRHENDRLDCR